MSSPLRSPIIEQIAICLFSSLSQLMRDSHQPGFEDFGRLVDHLVFVAGSIKTRNGGKKGLTTLWFVVAGFASLCRWA
jgi:hypothetical protein